MAIYLVALANFASNVRALFLDKKVSAPPAMAPLIPAVFPDWDRTTTVRTTAETSCKTVIMVFNMNFVPFKKVSISALKNNLIRRSYYHMNRHFASHFYPYFYFKRKEGKVSTLRTRALKIHNFVTLIGIKGSIIRS